MPTLKTSKGDTYEVEYASAPDIMGNCSIGLPAVETRLPEIAEHFDELEWVDYENEYNGRSDHWDGYTELTLLSRGLDGTVQIGLSRPRNKEG